MFKKWEIKKHPDFESLKYIETGNGRLQSVSVGQDEFFRLAAKAPEMYNLLEEIHQLEHLSPAIKAEIERLFQEIDGQ